MAYLHQRSFTETMLSKSFAYTPGMVLSFDAEFSINGDTSPSARGNSNFYSMAEYRIFLQGDTTTLGGTQYAAATTTYPYDHGGKTEFFPDGLEHYQHDIASLASDLGVAVQDIDNVLLQFRGYSSWWSSDDIIVRFDNVCTSPVPIPAAAWLLGCGMLGLVGIRRRFTR